jgi:hypothetical protein
MKRQPWPAWKVACYVGALLIGLVFFWFGVGIWIIPASALVMFAALSY